jgi:hypothetical protein
MAIHIVTDRSEELLAHIRRLIDDGKIKTWSYDADGDFTHTANQWKLKAWLQPEARPGELLLLILAPKGVGMTKAVYGIYHGRFIETVLSHADTMFTSARASAMGEPGDNIDGV